MSFIPELELAEQYYEQVVKPVLDGLIPENSYSIGLLGEGSGVLGYDTELSTDHDWGPRLELFIKEKSEAARIINILSEKLPQEFQGFPARFSKGGSDVVHHVEVHTVAEYFEAHLGVQSLNNVNIVDWLTFPENKLLYLIKGKIFHDGLGQLNQIRSSLQYFPDDVWLYILASQWRLLSQEMPFVGRCGDVGDELGSRAIATRQAYRVMRMAFLLEKTYAPYNKWFGTAFKGLKLAEDLTPVLDKAMSISDWKEREANLAEAYLILVTDFNRLELLPSVKSNKKPFFTRPYTVIDLPAWDDIQMLISNEQLRSLPIGVGSIDQITDNVDVLEQQAVFRKFINIYNQSA